VHRGRLNMLVTLMGKAPGAVFAKMNDADSEFHVGDVKYHAGEAATLTFEQVTVWSMLYSALLVHLNRCQSPDQGLCVLDAHRAGSLAPATCARTWAPKLSNSMQLSQFDTLPDKIPV
jgi:hypothetical protein